MWGNQGMENFKKWVIYGLVKVSIKKSYEENYHIVTVYILLI